MSATGYYGDSEAPHAVRTDPDHGTDCACKFATVCIVNPSVRFTLGWVPLDDDETDELAEPSASSSPKCRSTSTSHRQSAGVAALFASLTTGGQHDLYDANDLFVEFRETTEILTQMQSKPRGERGGSRRPRRLSGTRMRRHDRTQDALVRDSPRTRGTGPHQ